MRSRARQHSSQPSFFRPHGGTRGPLAAAAFAMALLALHVPPAAGQANLTLAGLLWLDRDGNDLLDLGEPGFVGVTVELLDPSGISLASTMTAAFGSYSFNGLVSGDYTLRPNLSSLPGGIVQTYDVDGFLDGETSVTLIAGEDQDGLDFGYQGTAALGGLVFLDYNSDGVQDPAEDGLDGASLTVSDGSGQTVATATTASDGSYTVDGLPAGNFTVAIDPVSIPGLNPASDPDGVADHQTTVLLVAGESRVDLDFGYNGDGVLNGRLFLDLDGDGLQGAGEPGIAGTTLELLDEFGTPLATKTSGPGGVYQFTGVPSYQPLTLRVDASTLPAGVSQTADPDGVFDHEAAINLYWGEVSNDLDFGYVGTATVGDLVFLDLDGDGLEGPGESGLAGVTLYLTDLATGEVATTTTDAFGSYHFSGLPEQSFGLAIDPATLPAGANPVTDPDGVLDNETFFTTSNGEVRSDLDFGYNGSGSLGDRVFLDADNDGVEGPGDAGLEGVELELLDLFGTPLATATTNPEGGYSFGNLAAGDYIVRVLNATLPAGASQTFDPDGVSDHETSLTLATGEVRTDIDFGYDAENVGGISARVWNDQDGNGIDDSTEPGISGVNVTLLDDFGGTVDVNLTNGNGEIQFDALPAGTYTLLVDDTSLPTAYTQTFDSDGLSTPHTVQITISAGESNGDSTFGYIGPGSIAARVWDDQDGNGFEDGNEPGIGGVSVTLLDHFGSSLDVRLTNGNGEVSFDTLLPGTYTLLVDESDLPTAYTQTFDSDGLSTPHTVQLTISAGELNSGTAFGYTGPVAQPQRAALLVVLDDSQLGAGDAAVRDHLLGLGYQVTLRGQAASASSDANGMDVVLISSTVTSSQVNSKFRDVAVPVMTWEPFVLDDMKMTGTMAHTDYGSIEGQTTIDIVDSAHPLAAGLSGTVSVLGSADRITWGRPVSSALTIATPAGEATRSALFAYEAGAPMVGINAPARRLGIFLTDASAATLGTAGWDLFDAALCWSTNCTGAPIPQISATPTQGSEPLLVSFDASQSIPGANPIDTFSWDFGDGTSGNGAALSHTYSAGTWVATLTVTDTAAMSASTSVTITVGPASPTAQALLVSNSTVLGTSDAAVRSRLESLGFGVTVVEAQSSSAADASGMDLVLISSTVNSSHVNTKFRDVAVPLITWEAWLYDDLKMTISGTNVGYGRIENQTHLEITDSAHPLAAGLSGQVSIVPGATFLRWGAPEASAQVVATMVGNSSRALIFGYEAGATMAGQSAPARRVGVPFYDDSAENFSAEGWALFDAAVGWATGG